MDAIHISKLDPLFYVTAVVSQLKQLALRYNISTQRIKCFHIYHKKMLSHPFSEKKQTNAYDVMALCGNTNTTTN